MHFWFLTPFIDALLVPGIMEFIDVVLSPSDLSSMHFWFLTPFIDALLVSNPFHRCTFGFFAPIINAQRSPTTLKNASSMYLEARDTLMNWGLAGIPKCGNGDTLMDWGLAGIQKMAIK